MVFIFARNLDVGSSTSQFLEYPTHLCILESYFIESWRGMFAGKHVDFADPV